MEKGVLCVGGGYCEPLPSIRIVVIEDGPDDADMLVGDGYEDSASQETPMLNSYRASCHCGKVVVTADLDLTQPSYRCNCSICRRNRFWAGIAKPDGFKVLSGADELTKYLFGTGKGQHFFCKHCGVRVFGAGQGMYGINIGCLEGVTDEQLSQIPITYVDGMNDRWNEKPEFWQHL